MINNLTQQLLLAAAEQLRQQNWLQNEQQELQHKRQQQQNVTVAAGTVFGPFAVRLTDPEDLSPWAFTMHSTDGRTCRLVALGAEGALLAQMRAAPMQNAANSHAILKENSLYIIVRETLSSLSSLRPILVTPAVPTPRPSPTNFTSTQTAKKEFECSDCTLGFTNLDTLIRHRAFYCKRLLVQQGGENLPCEAQKADPLTSHLLILPVTCHNGIADITTALTILGQPQILLPMAIQRESDPQKSKPLAPLTSYCMHDDKCIPSTSASVPADNEAPLDLRTRRRPSDASHNFSTLTETSAPKRQKCQSLTNQPTIEVASATRRANSQPSAGALATTSRRFVCVCGVSFLSRETYEGHRRYYCRNRTQLNADDETSSADMSDISIGCTLCNTHVASQAQLARHLRVAHLTLNPPISPTAIATTTRCFLCRLCGYKGYSERGIRNHLRAAHDAPFSELTVLSSETEK